MASPGQKPLPNPRQEKFAREYSRHGKGERAVVAAGYNARTWKQDGSTSACVQANVLLKDPKILQRIQYIQENRARSADLTELRLIQELKRISFFDIRKIFDEEGNLKRISDLDADSAAAVSAVEVEKLFQPDPETGRRAHVGYTVKVKTNNKIDAIEKLMQYFSMIAVPDPDKKGDTINNTQVNFYLPENKRHAKVVNGVHEPAPTQITHQEPADLIALPGKRTNGHA